MSPNAQSDWLSEVSGEEVGEMLEWPSPSRQPSRRQAAHNGDDGAEPLEIPVRHLFPVPDGTDWDVGELDYDREDARIN